MIRLFTESITDSNARDLLNSLLDQLNEIPQIKGTWQFIEFTVATATTNYKHPHRLGFIPKDVLVLSTRGSGSIVWNYDDFTSTNLNVTTSGGSITVRAFVGTYQEG